MGSTTPLKFKQGLDENLEQVAHDEGTVYIAKAGNNRAFMYADLDNVRYNITTPNKTYYGVSPEVKPDEPTNDNWQTIKTVTCDDFVLEPGATITVLFSSSLQLYNATLNVSNSGAIPIAYRGEVSSHKFLPANSVYTFIYINGKFHLVGDIDQVNNGVHVEPQPQNTNRPLLLLNDEYTGDVYKSAHGEYSPGLTYNGYSLVLTNSSLHINDPVSDGYNLLGGSWITYHDDDGNIGPAIYFENDLMRLYHDNVGDIMVLRNNRNIDAYGNVTIHKDLQVTGDVYARERRLPHVWYGTTTPDSSIGQDGDIYIMYS